MHFFYLFWLKKITGISNRSRVHIDIGYLTNEVHIENHWDVYLFTSFKNHLDKEGLIKYLLNITS
jgi:hypothetical protein